MEQPTTSNSNGVTSIGGASTSTATTTASTTAMDVDEHERTTTRQHAALDQQSLPPPSSSALPKNPSPIVIKEEIGSHAVASASSGYFDGHSAGSTPNHNDIANYHLQQQQHYAKYGRSSSGGKEVAYAPPPQAAPPAIDLSEFIESRVLAKHQDMYVTGAIRRVEDSNAILVELDHPEGCRQMYYDILGNGRYDVVSDASPSVNEVSNEDNFSNYVSFWYKNSSCFTLLTIPAF